MKNRYKPIFAVKNLSLCFLLLLLGAGGIPDNSFEKLGIAPGQFYYQERPEVGVDSTGVTPQCAELTEAKLQSFSLPLHCEKRSWFNIHYQYCTDKREALVIFEKRSDCDKKRQDYLETEG